MERIRWNGPQSFSTTSRNAACGRVGAVRLRTTRARKRLSTDVACTISLTAGAGGAHQFQETGTLNVQISNSAGTVLSNVTVDVGLIVTITV